MEEELIFKLLGSIGVPAAICFYTLHGVKRTLERQTETLKDLAIAINKLASEVDKNKSEQVRELDKVKDEVKELRFRMEALQNERH